MNQNAGTIISAIKAWQANRQTTYTPAGILHDYGDTIIAAFSGKGNDDHPAPLLREAFKLSPQEQFALACAIANNIGYDLVDESKHPDSPHGPVPLQGDRATVSALALPTRDEMAEIVYEGAHRA